jgi:hypothetical protein
MIKEITCLILSEIMCLSPYFKRFTANILNSHVEMMGLIGMGNNPMVGATVAVAVGIEESARDGKF